MLKKWIDKVNLNKNKVFKARCPLKKNSIFANDHRKKINSSSVDTSLELKNTWLSLKIISYFLR